MTKQKFVQLLALLGFLGLVACGDQRSTGVDSGFISDGVETYDIFGGQEVKKDEPITKHIVAIVYEVNGAKKTCTGTLIAPQVVLTAGHCAVGKNGKTRVHFLIRDLDSMKNNPASLVRRVQSVRILEGFEAGRSKWRPNPRDLALFKLDQPAPKSMRPMRISRAIEDSMNLSTVWAAGYGAQSYLYPKVEGAAGQPSGQGPLRLAEIPMRDTDYENIIRLDQSKGSGVCVGDSGGPIMRKTDTGYLLIGVFSTVSGSTSDEACASSSNNVSVAAWSDWIDETIENDFGLVPLIL